MAEAKHFLGHGVRELFDTFVEFGFDSADGPGGARREVDDADDLEERGGKGGREGGRVNHDVPSDQKKRNERGNRKLKKRHQNAFENSSPPVL
jgi:hypothetical protein